MMPISIHKSARILFLSSVGFAALSACSTTTAGLTAGGATPGHTAQNYETITSTAATTSTLGGSQMSFHSPTGAATVPIFTVVSTTGSRNNSTGGLTLDDGTYLFVDANGPDATTGAVTDGTATGRVGQAALAYTGVYNYLTPYDLSYSKNGKNYNTFGIAGVITDTSDMPVAGSATYHGEAAALSRINSGASGRLTEYSQGKSTVTANFGSGTASVDMGSFAKITQGISTVPVPAGTEPMNQIHGTGLQISGAHFTGGTWVTQKNGVTVQLLGAGATSSASGTFFGYDPNQSAPSEAGGVVEIFSGTGYVLGEYIAK